MVAASLARVASSGGQERSAHEPAQCSLRVGLLGCQGDSDTQDEPTRIRTAPARGPSRLSESVGGLLAVSLPGPPCRAAYHPPATRAIGHVTRAIGHVTRAVGHVTRAIGHVTCIIGHVIRIICHVTHTIGNVTSTIGNVIRTLSNVTLAIALLTVSRAAQQQPSQLEF